MADPQHHPDRNPDDQVAAQRKLDEICEAYDVLSDREPRTALQLSLLAESFVPAMHRVVYDQHGRRGLTQGVADGRGGTVLRPGVPECLA